MAKIDLNPLFSSLNGRIGGLVFYSYNGATYCRTYVRPVNPNTEKQQRNRNLFAEAMKTWHGLSSFDKESFRRRAKRLGMTGHNLFISRYMKLRMVRQSISENHNRISLDSMARHHSVYHPGHSVRASFEGLNANNPCYGTVNHRQRPPGLQALPARAS